MFTIYLHKLAATYTVGPGYNNCAHTLNVHWFLSVNDTGFIGNVHFEPMHSLFLSPGNVVNGTIGKQMVDMLVESSNNVEMILKFFDMFLKLKDLTPSDTFKEYDPDGKELFQEGLSQSHESHKHYTQSETEFLLSCAETDENETWLWRICQTVSTSLPRTLASMWQCFWQTSLNTCPMTPGCRLELAERVCSITSSPLAASRSWAVPSALERVYFEISESTNPVGEAPGQGIQKAIYIWRVNEGGEKEKMELFVNFCEDTIFEMQLAAQISESDLNERSANKEESEKGEAGGAGSEDGFSIMTVKSRPVCPQVQYLDLMRMSAWKAWRSRWRRWRRWQWRTWSQLSFTSYWSILMSLLHFVASVLFRGFFASSAALPAGRKPGRRCKEDQSGVSSWPTCQTPRKMRSGGETGRRGRGNPEGALPSEDSIDWRNWQRRVTCFPISLAWTWSEKGGSTNWFLTIPMLAWVTSWATPFLGPRGERKVPGNLPPVTAALWTSGGHDRWTWHQLFCLCQSGVHVDDLTFQRVMVLRRQSQPAFWRSFTNYFIELWRYKLWYSLSRH